MQGTLEHYNHLILASVRWWNQSIVDGLAPTFTRMYDPTSLNISSAEWFHYWEADIAGTVSYPTGIKMVVGTFRSLFVRSPPHFSICLCHTTDC